jgi:hypothetical protein
MCEVDLDRLASAYRFRPASKASLDRAARAGARLTPAARILDVGGGPGNHSSVWAGQGHHPIVLDPSPAMVATACSRHIDAVAGRAQAMPFRSRSFALVWFHLSIHYDDWRAALDEALRVADDAGRVEVWTLGEDHHSQSILAQWFPSVGVIDARRFPDPRQIEAYLANRRPMVAATHPHETVVRPVGAWLHAVEAGFVSTLHMLTDSERLAGIEAIRMAYSDPAEEISYELRFTRITADQQHGEQTGRPVET